MVCAALLTGCSGTDITGDWDGDWTSATGVRGDLSFSLEQDGDLVSGSADFSGSNCFSGGKVDGRLSDDDDFRGSLEAGSIQIDFDGAVTDDRMNGTYRAVSAGLCTGDTGTFDARLR
jgi:hypothetical protein